MRAATVAVAVLALFATAANAFVAPSSTSFTVLANGDEYESLSAADKARFIQTNVEKNVAPVKWPGATSALKLLRSDVSGSFDYVSDFLPSEIPVKLIHSVGAIAKISFVATNDTPYTGLFTGFENGFARFSWAQKPSGSSTVPGIAIKGLRDGVPSGNIFGVYSLDGQESWNFFKNPFTNHAGEPTGAAAKVVRKKFAEASKYPNMLGLSEFAKTAQDGSTVAVAKAPFRVVLEPSSKVAALFGDQKVGKADENPGAELSRVPVGSVLYTVLAEAYPGAKLSKIGELKLESRITASRFGDTSLFFRHTRMENDYALHPEWLPKEF